MFELDPIGLANPAGMAQSFPVCKQYMPFRAEWQGQSTIWLAEGRDYNERDRNPPSYNPPEQICRGLCV